MPNDVNGQRLKLGDRVALFGRVAEFFGGDRINIRVELDELMPNAQHQTSLYICSTQVVSREAMDGKGKA